MKRRKKDETTIFKANGDNFLSFKLRAVILHRWRTQVYKSFNKRPSKDLPLPLPSDVPPLVFRGEVHKEGAPGGLRHLASAERSSSPKTPGFLRSFYGFSLGFWMFPWVFKVFLWFFLGFLDFSLGF